MFYKVATNTENVEKNKKYSTHEYRTTAPRREGRLSSCEPLVDCSSIHQQIILSYVCYYSKTPYLLMANNTNSRLLHKVLSNTHFLCKAHQSSCA